MRFSFARRFALAAFVPTFLVFSVVPGCSNESEGERCGDKLGPDSSDCADGLTCVEAARLLNANEANRCCYPGLMIVNDSRCLPSGATVATGGAGGTGAAGNGEAGAAPAGGTSAGGTSAGGTSDVTAGAGTDAASAGAGDAAAGSN